MTYFGRLRRLVVKMSEVVICRENNVCSLEMRGERLCVCVLGGLHPLRFFPARRPQVLRKRNLRRVLPGPSTRETGVLLWCCAQVQSICWSSMRPCEPPV